MIKRLFIFAGIVVAALGATLATVMYVNVLSNSPNTIKTSLAYCPAHPQPYMRLGGFPLRMYKFNFCGNAVLDVKKFFIDFAFWIAVGLLVVWAYNRFVRRKK